MEKVKTAIIGCGKVAHLHAAGLSKLQESKFTAVCSRNPERANAFAEQYEVKAFTSLDDLIDQSGVEAAMICTPHPAHAASAVKLAKAGINVLVEKPLASSLKDCDAMIEAADSGGVKLGTVCQRRWYTPVLRVREAIDAGKIGQPVLGSVIMHGWRDKAYYESDPWRGKWEEEGGGVLVNQAPHQLDLLQWFMGPIEELFGYWDNLNHPYIEVEDTAIAVIRFKNGGLGTIVVSNSQKPGIYGKIHIHGENGATVGVQPEGGAMFIAGMSEVAEPPVNDLWTVPGEEEKLSKWQEEDGEFFNSIKASEYYIQLQIQDFLQAIIKGQNPLITGQEGRKTVELFTAIYRSQRSGMPVKFPLAPMDEDTDYSDECWTAGYFSGNK
jgi:UDP-N-acetyl-2-amino-2-deoxyglucuronate dehydrogenase